MSDSILQLPWIKLWPQNTAELCALGASQLPLLSKCCKRNTLLLVETYHINVGEHEQERRDKLEQSCSATVMICGSAAAPDEGQQAAQSYGA